MSYSDQPPDVGIEVPLGSHGDSYDTALAEVISGLYQAEVICWQGPWESGEAVVCPPLEWAGGLNQRRIWEPIGNVPSAELGAAYYRQEEEPATVA